MVNIETNPLYFASIGGILLGIATSLNYCLRGKVTGMSGILYGIISCNQQEEIPEKISIVAGMLLASGIFFDIFQYGTSNNFTPFGPENMIATQTSYIGYALAGLLVGFGTKLSNGCTSGHGLCGISRFSLRSFVAVCTFLLTAIGVSTLRYYVTLGPFTDQDLNPFISINHQISSNICIGVGVVLFILGIILKKRNAIHHHHKITTNQIICDQVITFIVGIIFGCGLLVSGMVRRVNIIDFLGLGQNWNPSLLFVLGCGVIVNLITFNYMIRVKKVAFLGHKLFNPSNSHIDAKLLGGAFCFGVGWGIGGLCPGPAIMQLSIFTIPIHLIWMVCVFIGMFVAYLVNRLTEHKQKTHSQKQSSDLPLKIQNLSSSQIYLKKKNSSEMILEDNLIKN